MGGAASLSAGNKNAANEDEGGSKISSLINTIGLKGTSLLNRLRNRAGSVEEARSPSDASPTGKEMEKPKSKRKKSKSQKRVSAGGPEDAEDSNDPGAGGGGEASKVIKTLLSEP